MPRLAPERELRVGLRLIYRAIIHARNIALNPSTPHKKIEDLMDTINHLPELLADWERFDEKTLFIHLAAYDDKWSGKDCNFNLKQTFLDLLKYGAA